jgi:hypothetical protein
VALSTSELFEFLETEHARAFHRERSQIRTLSISSRCAEIFEKDTTSAEIVNIIIAISVRAAMIFIQTADTLEVDQIRLG